MTKFMPADETMAPNYEVVLRIEVRASTPEKAAMIARDMMLDPTAHITVNIHPMEYVELAGEWFPTDEHGWHARFGILNTVYPSDCIEWVRHKAK